MQTFFAGLRAIYDQIFCFDFFLSHIVRTRNFDAVVVVSSIEKEKIEIKKLPLNPELQLALAKADRFEDISFYSLLNVYGGKYVKSA